MTGKSPANIRILKACSGDAADGVLAIGNFDGVHRGHQALLGAARALADKAGQKLAILTFEPHPRRLFQPDGPPFRITPESLKAARLALNGADVLFSLPFDWAFASQSAEQFIESVLGPIRPSHVIVGGDFRFGQLRKGTPEMIAQAGYTVTIFEKAADGSGAPVSSSRIRTALQQGDIAAANNLLGWKWHIEGPVVSGDKRGRELGFPTANVRLGETIHPAYGIYAAHAQIEGAQDWLPAAVNIGIRPMFELREGQVEAHIIDFSGDLYGKTLRVRPVKRLRGEAKFPDLEALIKQIKQDCADTRHLLSMSS
jgi:riboflavin kinase/FMN adenylyltransferase